MRQNMKMEAPIWVRFFKMESGMRALASIYHSQKPKTKTNIPPMMKSTMIRQSGVSADEHNLEIQILTGPGVVITSPLESEQETSDTSEDQG
jgi:hypothetical protein